jgi:hypothetical protein
MMTFEGFIVRFSRTSAVSEFAYDDELVDMLAAREPVASWQHVPPATTCFVYWYAGPRGVYTRGQTALWSLTDGAVDGRSTYPLPELGTTPSRHLAYLWTPLPPWGRPEAMAAGHVLLFDDLTGAPAGA